MRPPAHVRAKRVPIGAPYLGGRISRDHVGSWESSAFLFGSRRKPWSTKSVVCIGGKADVSLLVCSHVCDANGRARAGGAVADAHVHEGGTPAEDVRIVRADTGIVEHPLHTDICIVERPLHAECLPHEDAPTEKLSTCAGATRLVQTILYGSREHGRAAETFGC